MLLLAVVVYTICQLEQSHGASLSTQHVRLSGVPLRRPDSLELTASLPDELTDADITNSFRWFLKTILFNRY